MCNLFTRWKQETRIHVPYTHHHRVKICLRIFTLIESFAYVSQQFVDTWREREREEGRVANVRWLKIGTYTVRDRRAASRSTFRMRILLECAVLPGEKSSSKTDDNKHRNKNLFVLLRRMSICPHETNICTLTGLIWRRFDVIGSDTDFIHSHKKISKSQKLLNAAYSEEFFLSIFEVVAKIFK